MWRFNLMLLVAALAVIWSVGSASADPLKNRNAFTTTLACSNGASIEVVSTNAAASAQIIDETGVLIFRSGTITVRDAANPATIVDVIPFTYGNGAKTGLQGNLITCTTSDMTTDPDTGQLVQVDYEYVFTVVPHHTR